MRLPPLACTFGCWIAAFCIVLPYPVYTAYLDLGVSDKTFQRFWGHFIWILCRLCVERFIWKCNSKESGFARWIWRTICKTTSGVYSSSREYSLGGFPNKVESFGFIESLVDRLLFQDTGPFPRKEKNYILRFIFRNGANAAQWRTRNHRFVYRFFVIRRSLPYFFLNAIT